MELSMSKTDTVSPLRQRMIEDMAARKLNPHTQRSHVSSCKRFAAWLKRSPDTATAEDVRRFQLHLVESGASICNRNRNRIMTGVRFLFRVTPRRHDLAAEIWHIKEPQKLPPVLSPEEVKRVLTMATSLKARAMLTLAYGCGLRASEVARLRACDIPGSSPIGANISGPWIGTCVFFAEALADDGTEPPSGFAGKRRSARDDRLQQGSD